MLQKTRFSKKLSTEEKIGQMLIVGFHGLKPPEYILDWLANGRIGGIILFARNIANPIQVSELTRTCHEASIHPLLIAIDQEGGVVARLREGFTESPGAMALGAVNSGLLAEKVSTILGIEMRSLGINWNLAPVIDLTYDIQNPSVGVRSLGTDPLRVSKLGVAQIRGFQNSGVAATAKHFPGKANTPIDPHVRLPIIDDPLDDIIDRDILPFRAASEASVAAIMVTHVQFKAIEPKYPSTLSSRIIEGLLRKNVGFSGLVTTDCMEMKAITNKWGPGRSAVLAALAGANVILFSHTREYQEAAYDTLLDAVYSDYLPMDKIDLAVDKIQTIKEQFAITKQPTLELIRHPDHLEIMAEAARAGTVLLKNSTGVLPLNENSGHIALLEFTSHLKTKAQILGSQTLLTMKLSKSFPHMESLLLDFNEPSEDSLVKAQDIVSYTDIIVVATRNAHLNPKQKKIAYELLSSGKKRILVCLRNPYDAGVLTDAEVILCTCGDSAPSISAAVEVLLGGYTPRAKLPVPLSMK